MPNHSDEFYDTHWITFYKICGITTFIMIIFFVFDVLAWILWGPYPKSAEQWFSLLNENKHIGLLLLSFPTFLGTILYFLTFFGLYNTLKPINVLFAAIALIFSFAGLIILINTNFSYPIAFLYEQYANATSELQRTILLAAGETKLVTMSVGILIGGLFVETSAVLFSIIMLKSKIFGVFVAVLGILGHGLDLIRIVLILAFIPEDDVAILLMIGGIPQFIWLAFVGVKFLKLEQSIK